MSPIFHYLPSCLSRPPAARRPLALLLPAAVVAQAPTVSSLSPGSGPLGATVTLAGSNLGGATSVLVGGVPATFVPGSASQLTFTVPRQAVSQRVRATTASGTSLSAATFQVTCPSTSGVFPALGNLLTSILDAGFAVIPAVTDMDGDGRLDLLVGTRAGTVLCYEQTPPPALTGISPASGPLGTTLTLTGTNLTGLTSVLVGGVSAASFTVQSATQATAVVPRQAVNQRVRASNAIGSGLSPAAFQVTRPSASAVLPSLGNLMTNGTAALNAGSYAIPTVTDVDSDGRLDLLVGNNAGNVQRYEQTATNGGNFALVGTLTTDGTTALSAAGGSAAPAVTDLDGDGLLDLLVGNYSRFVQRYEQTAAGSGIFAQVGPLTTDGSNGLYAGNSNAPTVTDVDGDGLLDLLVSNDNGDVRRFEQDPVPTVTALNRLAELPGQAVTLTGTGFVAGSTVRFGGVAAASVTYTSATQLTAVVPVGASPGSSAITVGSYDVASPAASSPAFEVLQVYRTATASGCLATASLTVSGTGGAGVWRYLRLPGTGGAVVAAIEDTRNLGTVTAGVLALGTSTGSAVRADSRANRRYLDRNFYLTATNASFTGQTVRVRLFGLTSELARLTAVDPAATAATLNASQYDGANVNCALADNSPAGERRLLAAPATVPPGADWFTAQMSVTEHFSEFYLTGASSPLPVELTAFTARATGPAAVQLAWTTASEQNSAAFAVERSVDGERFVAIGTVAAAGTSSAPRRYELLNGQLPGGASQLYYRLRQVDQDGTFSYSPVRTVALPGTTLTGAGAGLSLYPNPTRGAATLTGAAPGTVVTVFDALGRPVATAMADASGTAALVLPAGSYPVGLPASVYVVRAGSKVLRLTVE